ncbi:MAG: hypothetical protein J5601_06675 [Elusimicrobiaceae bacterium]|nr:hypothetical protein [Elusimicrobiaceae bacterium]
MFVRNTSLLVIVSLLAVSCVALPPAPGGKGGGALKALEERIQAIVKQDLYRHDFYVREFKNPVVEISSPLIKEMPIFKPEIALLQGSKKLNLTTVYDSPAMRDLLAEGLEALAKEGYNFYGGFAPDLAALEAATRTYPIEEYGMSPKQAAEELLLFSTRHIRGFGYVKVFEKGTGSGEHAQSVLVPVTHTGPEGNFNGVTWTHYLGSTPAEEICFPEVPGARGFQCELDPDPNAPLPAPLPSETQVHQGSQDPHDLLRIPPAPPHM